MGSKDFLRKEGATTVYVAIAVAIFGIFGLCGTALGASFFGLVPWGDNAPGMKAGSISCSNWNQPYDYQDVFTRAASNYGINPAIVATMFSSEHHTTSWPESPQTQKWASSSAGASGPFQFMPGTWQSNGVDGNGDGKKDIQNLTDASFGAARFIKSLLSNVAEKRYNTVDEKDIKLVSGSYNWGWGTSAGVNHLDEMKKYLDGQDSRTPQETKDYMDHAWEYFQQFNNGCQANTGSASTIGSYDTSFMNKEPVKSWLAARKRDSDKKLTPTGVTLHWTGAWDESEGGSAGAVSKLIDAWNSRTDCPSKPCSTYNHLVIDKQGKVYQIVPFNLKQSGSGKKVNDKGDNANDFTIGIEIAGSGFEDLNGNVTQKNAVLGVVRSLMANYSIQPLRGNDGNFNAEKGIFGHYQVGTHPDPTEAYMKWIWGEINAI